MTSIIIPLKIGENYISFPEYSTLSFRTIFTNSGIIDYIVNFSGFDFYRFDSIMNSFIPIDLDLEQMIQGIGYLLIINSNMIITPQIIYEGIPFAIPLNFDMLRANLFQGWNLIGPDRNIAVPDWCKFIDASTNYNTNIISPKKAFWINTGQCAIPISVQNPYIPYIVLIGTIGGIIITYRVLIQDFIKQLKEVKTKIMKL